MRLRPYQEEAVNGIVDRLNAHRSTLAVMATGLGKTVVFSHVADRWPQGRVVVMAHREELIDQAAEKIHAVTGEQPAVEMGERASDEGYFRSRIVVTSVQTMCRPRRFSRFRPHEFGLLVIDEAHHAVASTYKKVIDHFGQNPGLKILGVTATPKRSDEAAMGQVFESVACDCGIEWAVGDGWLVPVRQRVVVVDRLDFTKLHTVAGDFNQGELEEIVAQEEILHKMAVPTVDLAGDRPALVFCVGVKQAALLAAVLNRYKPGSAAMVSGETPKDERRDLVNQYRDGRLQFLCNCGVFLEGFDAPATELIVMGRPTRSLSLYVQCLGRGTRPLPGVVDRLAFGTADERRAAILGSPKPCVTVLDFVGNAQAHARNATVTAADVLGGKYGVEVRNYAKRTMQEEPSSAAVEEALDRADAELALLREEEERRRRVVAQAQYRVRDVEAVGAGPRREVEHGTAREPLTQKQYWKLRRLGVSDQQARGYTKKQAGVVISKLMARQEARAA